MALYTIFFQAFVISPELKEILFSFAKAPIPFLVPDQSLKPKPAAIFKYCSCVYTLFNNVVKLCSIILTKVGLLEEVDFNEIPVLQIILPFPSTAAIVKSFFPLFDLPTSILFSLKLCINAESGSNFPPVASTIILIWLFVSINSCSTFCLACIAATALAAS